MKNISFFIAAVLVHFQLQAQNITNYSFTASSGSFTQLTGGTTMNLSGGTVNEGWFNNIPIGFTFYYMGTASTTVSVSTNGWMTFGQDISAAVSGNNLTSGGARALVAPLWDNLDIQVNTNFSFLSTGTTPNRVFTAEWLNVRWYYLATGNTISFQVKLYEADKRIEFIYRPESGTVSGASASIGITATATGSGNFLSLNNSSSGPAASSTTETTNIAAKPADGQVYTFSPQYVTLPSDPITMTFTSITQTGMTVNWVDNSSTETFFLVYFSQDGTNFSQTGNIPSTTISGTGTSYSWSQSGLLPGVTYYFRVTANNEGSPPSGYLGGSNPTSSPGIVTSIASGNWADGATWSSASPPTSLDNVTIADGHSVTITGTANICNALSVGQGVSGILRFGTTASSLTTVQGITVVTNGIFDAGAPGGASLNHALSIGGSTATAMGTGSLTVNGTFDMYIGSSNGKCTINFFGIHDASVLGSGTIDFYRVILNKGNVTPTETAIPPVLEILKSYTGSGSATTGFIYTHTAGTLKIGGSFTFSNPVYTNGSYSIGDLGAIWLDNSTFTISGINGSPTNNGMVKLSAGIYNIGTASNNSIGAGDGAVFLIENGTMNVAGRLNTANTVTYRQTGGTVNVTTVGNTSSGNPGFGITDAGSVFTISSGTICVVLANTGATKIDYNVNASTTNITGGTFQLGNSSSGTAKTFFIRGIAPNVTLTSTSANHSCSLGGDLTIKGDLALNGTGTFSNNSNNLVLAGMNATNPGNIIINTGAYLTINTLAARSLTLNSAFGDQSITNNGTITGSQLPGLIIDNTYAGGGNVTVSGGLTMMGDATLNLIKGTLTVGSGGLTLGTGGTTGINYIRGDGITSGTITSNYGTGTVNYTYNGTSAQVTGTELPSSITGELTINNSNGVSLNSALQAGKLNLVTGTLATTASNLLTITGTATTDLTFAAGQVNGPMARTLPANLVSGSTYVFPLGKSIYRPLELVNPVTNSEGSVLIKAEVFDASCGGTSGSSMNSLNTDRYWTTEITSGASNFTSTTIRLTETGLTVNHGIAKSTTLDGTYELTSVTGPSGNTLITDVLTSLSYFVIGEKKMNFVSSTCTQANTTILRQASNDQEILGLQVVTAGNIDPAIITSLTFSTNGSTNTADITAAKVFYTGTSSAFSTAAQFGSSFSNPSGSFDITGSQALAEGINYFWLAYNISADAGNGNMIDGECASFTFRGSAKTPTIQAPAACRIIKAALSGTVTVGTSGTYTTFTDTGGLFEAINQAGLRGNLTVQVVSAITETGTNSISQIYEIGAGYTLTIQPDDATERTISGTYSGGLIRLAGADRITIDGSYGGSGRYLNIINTGTSGTIAAIQLISSGTGLGAKCNTIKNCKVSTGHNASGAYAIAAGGSTVGIAGDDNDSLTIRNCNISKAYYGIYIGANSTGVNNGLILDGDSIGSSETVNTVVKYGIYIQQCSGAEISKNSVFNVKASNTKPFGMFIGTGCVNSLVSGNRICGIIYTGTGTYGGTGLYINTANASSNLTVANNLVYDISGTGSSSLESGSILGMHITGNSGGISFYYNSINLSGTISNAISYDMSAAIYLSSSVNEGLNLQNNIFRNSISDLATNTTSYAIYCYQGEAIFGAIDYNDYSAEGTDAMLGHILYSDLSTIASWRGRTGEDVHSIALDPFYAGSIDLRIDITSPARRAGVPVGVLTDFNGVLRSATVPNMGAYETVEDLRGPFLSYTPLQRTASLSARTLSVILTDSTGVPTTGSGMPVLYWKINSGSWNSATGVYVSGNQYDFAFGAGVALNDIVSYYIAVQDICTPSNVSVSPSAGASGFSSNPPACSTPPSAPETYLVVEGLNDTITVGAGGTVTNLTGTSGLFKKIGDNLLTGNLTAEIVSDLTEEGTIQLTEWLEEGTGNYTLTIKPSDATERLISGNPAAVDMIRLNGADRVIVDGRYGGEGKYLRFRNESDLFGLFTFYNGACHDTIRYCYIEGASSNSTLGTIRLAYTTTSTGNSYNAILNNIIRDRTDASDLPYNAIYSSGTNGKENSFNTISGNEILNFTNYGINVTNTGNGSNWFISGNSIYNNLSAPPSTFQRGIYFFAGPNSVSNLISGNYIGGQEPLCEGSAWINSGYHISFYGIYANVGSSVASDISDNSIRNISLSNAEPGDFIGIYFAEGLADIAGNTIGHPDISKSISSGTTSYSYSLEGIRIFSDDWRCNAEENIITNLVFTGTSGYPEAYGIYILNADLRKNIITGIGHCLNSTMAPYIYGIYNYGLEGYYCEISNNVIILDGGASYDPEIHGYSEYSYSSNYYNFYYNSISISGPPTATSNTYAFYRYVDAEYELKNNIFANFRESGGTGINYAVYIEEYELLNLDADYNELYCPGGMVGHYDYNDLLTLSDWQTATGQDSHSISNDPQYQDNTGNLHPDADSPVVGAGTYIEWVETDIEGNSRDEVSPTIGAYEMAPPAVKSWNGSVSANWHDAGNWTPSGIPLADDNILIPSGTSNNCTLSTTGLVCRNLTVNAGATATVNSTASLDVYGIMTIKDGGLMTNYGDITVIGP
jgi:hypothetical protein